MKIYLILLMLLIGTVLTVHLSMNAQVGLIIKNQKLANAAFWGIGAITAILIALTSFEAEAFVRFKNVPIWLLSAGVMGAILVFGIAWVIPRIGSGSAFVLMITAQIITGLVLAHYGLLGSPVEHISTPKVLGALLVIGGAAIVTFTK